MNDVNDSGPSEHHPRAVFVDPTGRRARRTQRLAAVVAVAAVLVAAVFALSLMTRPGLHAELGSRSDNLPTAQHHKTNAERTLLRRVAADAAAKKTAALVPAQKISAGYFPPWQADALDSFRSHAADLTHIYPAWLELSEDGVGVSSADWHTRSTGAMIDIARTHGVRIVPVFGNASKGEFDDARVAAMLANRLWSVKVQDDLLNFLVVNHYAGLQIDFEALKPTTAKALVPWLDELHRKFAAQGLELSMAVETDARDDLIRGYAGATDYIVAMIYDEHDDKSEPGPIASAGFVRDNLKRFSRLVPADKLVVGVGAYGYDWTKGGKKADWVTNAEALAQAAGYRSDQKPSDVIDFDDQALEPTFDYMDDEGTRHEVWFMDAAAVANTMTIARTYGVRGAAMWALGQEDPGTWSVFGRNAQPTPNLTAFNYADQVDFTGEGELLRVVAQPSPGRRFLERDPASGLITDETYEAYPSGWVVRRRGAPAKTLALTFDDGPDPTWTPKILDILKKHKVKATFFMVGLQAADHPDIVRRVFAEGHEIGNHSYTHPNMARVGPERVKLELTATERALESITKRQVTLFRPPFNADSEPGSYGEIAPIAVATQMGFITAGESIDPTDWDLRRVGPGGVVHKLTADELVQDTLSKAGDGHAILLHDAGGDRSATVAALDRIITGLQDQGYKLVTVGELDGKSRDQTMPPLSVGDKRYALMDSVAFGFNWIMGTLLRWGFSAAIVLGLARIVFLIAVRGGDEAPPAAVDGEAPLRVDVLIAAYNEASVICRTIESVLASRGAEVCAIVIDDGSSDGTYEAVAAAYGNDPRVKLLRKPNGGKASALNLALTVADAPLVVGVDADTLLSPDALTRLAAWFRDPTIGAAAGNVKVGNVDNLVTLWQSIEYTTSQNVDRRALARLNAITVVPGAIGAWRTDVLREVGGYSADTLAEDMDLTWRVRQAGWRIANEPRALAFTEAPHTLSALTKQRFRWTYGTLQCLWKHRRAVFHYGWFGWFALPSLWVFQLMAQVLAPLIDVQLLAALVSRIWAWWSSTQHKDISFAPDPAVWVIVAIYVAFVVLEILAGWLAYKRDKGNMNELWLLPTQRFVYRQIMYIVVWRALGRAITGISQVWGKLHRTGAAKMAEHS